jgi:hypothetical protein
MNATGLWAFDELRPYADTIIERSNANGVVVRLTGGIGIRDRAADLHGLDAVTRRYHDLDLVGRVKQVRPLDALFRELGYRPDAEINTQFGTIRRVYHHDAGFHVDLFFERLEFCHTIDLNGRIDLQPRTLAPTDLLLQKLQIVERNAKDFFDVYLLLLNHELGEGDSRAVELDRLTALASDDWGLYTTACDFLDDALQLAAVTPMRGAARETVVGRLQAVRTALAQTPKSLRWKARNRVGRRVRWYRRVEEVL